MNIPDEAVEAAYACLGPDGAGFRYVNKARVRELLESAAPHLMAQAWDEAANVLYMGNAINQEHLKAMWAKNPYRSAGGGE